MLHATPVEEGGNPGTKSNDIDPQKNIVKKSDRQQQNRVDVIMPMMRVTEKAEQRGREEGGTAAAVVEDINPVLDVLILVHKNGYFIKLSSRKMAI
jgi:hypothetical protein